MNYAEALAKHIAGLTSLPWEISPEQATVHFLAGWQAHVEALKQGDLFSADVAQPVERPPCKREVVDSNSIAGSISAEDIYAAYPRKVGKQAAIKAINKVPSKWRDGGFAMREYLLERTKAYAAAVAHWPAADKQFIPFPATWFNRGSYDDDPKEWSRGAAATSQFTKTYR
jgi:hypothetical protein